MYLRNDEKAYRKMRIRHMPPSEPRSPTPAHQRTLSPTESCHCNQTNIYCHWEMLQLIDFDHHFSKGSAATA